MHSGSTLSASEEPPGRSGARNSSHARPSTIRPSKLPTARMRVVVTRGEEVWGSVVMDVFIGVAS